MSAPGLPSGPGPALRACARTVLSTGLHLVLPTRCALCGRITPPETLCPPCWSRLHFITAPACRLCALPFPFPPGPELTCPQCQASPPPWHTALAVLNYDSASSPLLLGLKYADRCDWVPMLARWMHDRAAGLTGSVDLVVPVPSHWRNQWRRRYNHAAELARALGRRADLPADPCALVRISRSTSRALGRRERRVRLRGQFRLRHNAPVPGRHVLLVDDVMTTMATMRECTRVLLEGGAASVGLLALARRS